MKPGFALCLAAACVCLPAAARAQDARADLDRYITSEYVNNGLFVAVGAASVGTSIYLFTRTDDFSHGVGYPLAIVGTVQLVIGAIYLGITPGIHRELSRQLGAQPEAYRRDEGARADGLNRAFPIFLVADGAVLIAGGVMLGVGTASNDAMLQGIGTGCLGAGVVETALDVSGFVFLHAHRDVVHSFRLSVGPGSVGLGGAF